MSDVNDERLAKAFMARMLHKADCFDDLLAVCKAMKAELDRLKWGRPSPGRPHAVMGAAEAAIAKAEEK
jgi:hypothetical protein